MRLDHITGTSKAYVRIEANGAHGIFCLWIFCCFDVSMTKRLCWSIFGFDGILRRHITTFHVPMWNYQKWWFSSHVSYMINKPDELFIERTPYPRNFQLIAFEYYTSDTLQHHPLPPSLSPPPPLPFTPVKLFGNVKSNRVLVNCNAIHNNDWVPHVRQKKKQNIFRILYDADHSFRPFSIRIMLLVEYYRQFYGTNAIKIVQPNLPE